jgi:hypothetical protein
LFLYNDKGFLSSKIKRIVQLRQFHLRKNSGRQRQSQSQRGTATIDY